MTRPLALAILGLAAAGAVAAFAYFAVQSGEDRRVAWIDPLDRDLVAHGKAVYAARCAECHGQKLEGQPEWRSLKEDGTLPAPPHDETGHTWHHPDQVLFDYTKKGGAAIAPPPFKSAMPAFGEDLSDRDIVAALAFIKSKWPPDARKRQKLVDEQYRRTSG